MTQVTEIYRVIDIDPWTINSISIDDRYAQIRFEDNSIMRVTVQSGEKLILEMPAKGINYKLIDLRIPQ